MSLPVTISPGYVSLYGAGSFQGIELPGATSLQFGIVNQLPYQYGSYQLGQNVLFRVTDADILSYQNQQYFIVPQSKIVLIEDPVTPP